MYFMFKVFESLHPQEYSVDNISYLTEGDPCVENIAKKESFVGPSYMGEPTLKTY